MSSGSAALSRVWIVAEPGVARFEDEARPRALERARSLESGAVWRRVWRRG
eukprot:CAMPEP_0113272144 /NCGR_PEP_ID=MMETSP0008_2-20120614/23162_1 /TAXON_ID=97485 /ORGANISM="Prymnesium parvum" /LENGTH=50 /DNA_ID=CAMNT_0000121577 /DNA_START=532 /DNA_END=680 /DNA_ORIENTATION=- /assembly_acc=CAM_ASM_000153